MTAAEPVRRLRLVPPIADEEPERPPPGAPAARAVPPARHVGPVTAAALVVWAVAMLWAIAAGWPLWPVMGGGAVVAVTVGVIGDLQGPRRGAW